jgi:enediyne biosynthesis protein E4
MGIDCRDLDNDGNEEIFVVDMLPEQNSRQKSMLGKMNYDKLKLATKEGYHPQFIKNTLQKNNGMLNDSLLPFSEISYYSGVSQTDWSWAPLLADFTNDGLTDLYITNGYGKDITDLDYISYNNAQEGFQSQINYNKQVFENLEKQASVTIQNQFFEGAINLKFINKTSEYFNENPSISNGAAYADLDNDGDLDIITNNINKPAFVFENTTTNGNYLQINLVGPEKNKDAIGTTIKLWAGGKLFYQYYCPVRGYLSSMDSKIHFGLGNLKTVDSLTIIWPNEKAKKVTNIAVNQLLNIKYDLQNTSIVKELDKHATYFIEKKNTINDWSHTENPFIDYSVQPLLTRQYSANGPVLKSVSFGQNQDILFLGASIGHTPEIWWLKNGILFKKQQLPICQADVSDAAFADIDNDNDLDLVITHGGFELAPTNNAYKTEIYLNQENTFKLAQYSNLIPSFASNCLAIADYDKDGKPDIFIGGGAIPQAFPKAEKSIIVSGNKIELMKNLGMVSDAAWVDFDHDSWVDLVVVGEWNSVKIFKNNKGHLRQIKNDTLENLKGMWRKIEVADVNNDGFDDLIIGNLGQNNKLQASTEFPLQMLNADIDKNGTNDPLIGFYLKDENNKKQLFPYHTRDDIMAQIPSLKKTYSSYNTFGNASFADIIGAFKVTKPNYFTCNTTASIVLINKKNMNFEAIDLPFQCQLSPTNSILANDFNKDGNIDLLLSQNDYSTETNGGWQDGSIGIMAIGDGKGRFKFIPNTQSGFIIKGDNRNMVLINNKKSFWVGVNNGAMKKFDLKPDLAF